MDQSAMKAQDRVKVNELIETLFEMFKADFKDRPYMSKFVDELRKKNEN